MKKRSISRRILLSYIITIAILFSLVTFIIITSAMTMGNLTKTDDYVTFYNYPIEASMAFSNARVKNRIMMMSIFYDESVYNDGISKMDDIESIFSDFKSKAGTYNLSKIITIIDKANEEVSRYKSLMVNNDANNKAKRTMQSNWSGQGASCVSVLNQINTYVNEHMSSLTNISQREYAIVYENKIAVDNIRNLFTSVRLDAREMMYMDETKNYQTILDNIDQITKMLSDYESAAYSEILPMIAELRAGFANYKDMTVQFNGLIQTTQSNTTMFESINAELENHLNEIINETTATVKSRIESVRSQQILILSTVSFWSAALIIFIIMYASIMIKSISKSLQTAAASLKEAVGNIDGASRQLSDAANSLAESGSEQAASIEETSATMNETASMAQQNTENTRKAAKLAADTMNATAQSVSDMNKLIEFMNKLSLSSGEISKIVGDINTIASQTNILALNASVEAVRAGDAGRSFAVVAEEVRSLSLQSTDSANNTAVIINENINLSSQSVRNCLEVGETLKNVFADIEKVNVLITEISSASEEQTHGMQQINIALSQMEKATQSNAAISQESAAAAGELKSQANDLSRIYDEIDALVYGKRTV